MEERINTIEIFRLRIKADENEVTTSVDIDENFTKLFPGNDMMGTILVAHVKSFMEELIHFISTRSAIIADGNKVMDVADEIREIVMPLCLDKDSSCILDVNPLKEVFETLRCQYEEKTQPAFDLFWEFILCEIHDFESDLSHEVNHFWGMKEKGIDIQVLKME